MHPHAGGIHMPLGDWATWVQSAATVGALAAAIVAAIVTRRVYKLESERDEKAAEERRARSEAERRAQADRVAAWFRWVPIPYTSDPSPFMRSEPSGWLSFVRNATDLPIYDVEVDFYYMTPDASPGNVPSRRGSSDRLSVVAPQDEVIVKTPEKILDQVDDKAKANHRVAVEFRDAAGIRWRRDIYGKLTELASAAPVA